MKSVFDPSFKYKPSFDTDLRKTFERIRREQKAADRKDADSTSGATVVKLTREVQTPRTGSGSR